MTRSICCSIPAIVGGFAVWMAGDHWLHCGESGTAAELGRGLALSRARGVARMVAY